jgi:hypothetical protein
MSLAAWHLLRHLCEYVEVHTRPTGRGCRDEMQAAAILYPTARRNVKAEPLKKKDSE